jgi:hypothetical protein
VRHVDVAPYGHAMIRPQMGVVCGAARRAAGDQLRSPVHFGHSNLSGLSLFEEAYHWGSRASARAAANLRRPLDASSVRP